MSIKATNHSYIHGSPTWMVRSQKIQIVMKRKGLDIQLLLIFMIWPGDQILRVASHWGVIMRI